MRRCVTHKGPSGAFVTYCNISCYFCFCSSHHSQCIFHSLRFVMLFLITLIVFSIHYFRYADFHRDQKILFLSFHIANGSKDDLSLTLPSLHLLHGIRWPRNFSCYFCFSSSHHSQCIFHSLHFVMLFLITLNVFSFRYADFHRDQKNPVSFVSYCKWSKGCFIIDFAFVTIVTFVTGY